MYNKEEEQRHNRLSQEFLNQELQVSSLEELRALLRYHEWKYYVQNNPVLADGEYDQLYKKLEKIEGANPLLVTPDSPTQRVASDLQEKTETVAHIKPMLSLANSYNAEDLIDFDQSVKRYLSIEADKDISYTVEPKFDGGSLSVVYENDLLIRAATRGNGARGEEMTANAKSLPSIPLKAAFSKHNFHKVELRGEGLIRKDNFDKINAQREVDQLQVFANPRNAATGGLRMKDANETRKRGIEVFIFQLGYAANAAGEETLDTLKTHYEGISLLRNLGFKVPREEIKLCANIKEAITFCEEWSAKRDSYAYEIDGMVVKVNELNLQERAGNTQHHPRWAIAYKFKAKQATTILEDVEYQIGKIGSITPVAKVKPVQLAGVTISSISLHNAEFIASKDLRIGDQVLIERAGDVIPYIVKSFPELRSPEIKEIQFPTHCPSCETALVKEETEAAWRCINNSCEAQMMQRMIYHVSKDAMDIDGFGKSFVERFYKIGWLKDLSDIYNLDYDGISKLEGFGKKSGENLHSAIAKAKQNPLHRILHSLSIHHVGKKVSKIIAQQIEHIFEIEKWTIEEFVDIKDIGPVVAENIVSYFKIPENIAMLKRMEAYGVDMSQKDADKPVQISADAPLINKSILFTGSLQKMGRKEAQALAVKAGAKNISAVSSKLNILVVGEKAGSKLKKAQALGTVEILTEDEFIALVKK